MSLASKLQPARFPNMSPLMAAINGYVFQQAYTKPQIAEIAISERENTVHIRATGPAHFNRREIHALTHSNGRSRSWTTTPSTE